MRVLLLTAAAILALVPLSAAPAPLRVVPTVDLTRYAGTWYEIARLPNRFQDKCAGEVVAEKIDRGWWREYTQRLARRFEQEAIHVRALQVLSLIHI